MTTQVGEVLIRDGKRIWMQTLPLEAFWEANPPRPFLLDGDSSACWRGYIGEWEISNNELFLTRFEANAWRTSSDWVGDDALSQLWSIAGVLDGTVRDAMELLSQLPSTVSPAVKRSARIVLVLGQRLMAQGGLKLTDYSQDLYQAAVDASWNCFKKERIPVTLRTLFPESQGRVLAAWYTGTISIGEGQVLDIQYGFGSTYEFTRLLEIRAGRVIVERIRKNDQPSLKQIEDPC